MGEVAGALSKIYKRGLKWPKLLQVDAGTEFMGVVTKTLKDHGTKVRRPKQSTTGVRASLKDLIRSWPSVSSDTSIGKNLIRRASEIGNGRRDSPRSSRH